MNFPFLNNDNETTCINSKLSKMFDVQISEFQKFGGLKILSTKVLRIFAVKKRNSASDTRLLQLKVGDESIYLLSIAISTEIVDLNTYLNFTLRYTFHSVVNNFAII